VKTWPKCPTCNADMGVAKIGAPVRTYHLCGTCDIKIQVDPPVVEDVQLPLFEIEEEP